ncbi:hypothetical protein HMPREF2811_02575 [Globicatella sp. HMSC072A10]|uniref:helix-turn-helix domain-containing protein n=1 Tax=Globicatella sp. HMSC072A10 TaxID=1739315 RepID=UPI0008D843E6|nr:helix-turn-helix transcriptional regulator [Globicatella sp. HMSC072A10]OFK62562.1 hypothetical protein HMPREF2811_02575 [Globicatella sp. HMSC072A10]
MKRKIGYKIKEIRMSLPDKPSMEEFGKLFDPPASKGVVSNWENDYNYPNESRLKQIAKLGNISVYELLYGYKEELMSFDTGEEFDNYRKKIIDQINNNKNSVEKSFLNNKTTLINMIKNEIASIELELEKIDNNNSNSIYPENKDIIYYQLEELIDKLELKIKEIENNPKYKFYIFYNIIYLIAEKEDIELSDIKFQSDLYDGLTIYVNNKETNVVKNLNNEILLHYIKDYHDWNTNIKLNKDKYYKVIDNPQDILN